MFSAGEECLAVIMPTERQLSRRYKGWNGEVVLRDVLTDDLHHQWSRADGLEVASGHLQDKTHRTWNDHNDTRSPLDPPLLPFGVFPPALARVFQELWQRIQRDEYTLVRACGEDNVSGAYGI